MWKHVWIHPGSLVHLKGNSGGPVGAGFARSLPQREAHSLPPLTLPRPPPLPSLLPPSTIHSPALSPVGLMREPLTRCGAKNMR